MKERRQRRTRRRLVLLTPLPGHTGFSANLSTVHNFTTSQPSGFDRSLVDFKLYKTPLKDAQGLAKLLLLEMMDLMRRPLVFEVAVPSPARSHVAPANWQFPLYQARHATRRNLPLTVLSVRTRGGIEIGLGPAVGGLPHMLPRGVRAMDASEATPGLLPLLACVEPKPATHPAALFGGGTH